MLFDPLSSSSIAESIQKIVNAPEYAKMLGNRGREKISSLTPERYCGQLENLFAELGQNTKEK